jgi:hypothetical protein
MATQAQLIGKQLADASTAAALQFITDHAADVKVLGEDKVAAFLKAAFHDALPLPVLADNPTPEHLADVQEALDARRTQFDLVAEAEATDAEIAARLKADAIGVAKKLAGTAVGLALSVGFKALIGA